MFTIFSNVFTIFSNVFTTFNTSIIIMPKSSARTRRLLQRNLSKTKLETPYSIRKTPYSIIQKIHKHKKTSTQPCNKHHQFQRKKTPHTTNTVDVRKNPHIQKYALERAKSMVVLNQRALECAKSMIALNQRVCCTCLGTRTVLKTKKNIRYSTVCRACSRL